MRVYEAMFIARPDLDEEAVAALQERFTSLITGQGGTVEHVDKWGKRRLAYEIDGHKDGVYTLVQFRGEAAVAHELDRVLRLTGDVLRHIIVRPGE